MADMASARGDEDVGVVDYDEDKALIQQLLAKRTLHRATSLQKVAKQDPDAELCLVNLDAKDENGRSVLHHAVMMQQTQMVKRLLSEGASPVMPNRLGRTPLHLATWTGNTALCSTLCDALLSMRGDLGQSVDARDVHGQTPLHWAAQKDSSDIVNILLDNRASVFVTDQHGVTPLHVAAEEGSSLALAELLRTKCDVNAKDNSGSTPLHYCALKGHGECLSRVLKAGANINELNQAHESPAHVAAARTDANTLSLLIEAGADLTLKNKLKKTPIHLMAAWGHHIALEKIPKDLDIYNAQDVFGKTVLHVTASWGQAKVLQILLEDGSKVNVNIEDQKGNTALYYAASWNKPLCVKLLLDAGADRTLQNKEGRTPLHAAVDGGSLTSVELLINNDVIDLQQRDGQTALHLSALAGEKSIMQKLLKCGAGVHTTDQKGQTVLHCLALNGNHFEVLQPYDPDINTRDKLGRTPLHHAVWNSNVECAAQLIQELEADVNAVDNKGMSPLHGAVFKGSVECAELLIHHQADVNAKDTDRRFVLHHAAIGANEKCIQLLIRHEVNATRKDWSGQTPLHYAAKLGHTDAVLSLLEHPGVRVNGKDNHMDTPLHLAAQSGHNGVVYALVNSGKVDLGLKNNQGQLAIDIAFKSYNKEIFQFLLDKITTKYDSTWMHEFLTNKSKDSDRMRELLRSQPESALVVFDGCIKKTPDQQGYVSVDFQYLDDLKQSPSKAHHPMHILASYENRDLLSHPLLLLCLKQKWGIAFSMYLIFLLYYTVFVFLFVAHMLAALPLISSVDDQSTASANYLGVSPYVLYIFSAIGMITEIVQFSLTRKQYLEWHNLLDWLSYVGAIVVVIEINGSGIKPNWQWELGCFVVLLQCMNLLFFLRVFPRFGIYVVMVSLILKTFIESFIVLVLFIIAFAMTFYLLLFNQYAFSTPAYSIMKSLVMMLGEIDFGDIFHAYKESPGPETQLNLEVMTYAVMCGFLLISLIIVNLLTGLAVSDVQMLRESSESQMISMQIDLALDLEFALLKWKNVHVRFYNKPSSITMSTTLIDMNQLYFLERWKHSLLSFFQGPLYRQDIIRKIIRIIDEREYANSSTTGGHQEISADVKHLTKTVLDKLNDKQASRGNPVLPNVLQVKPKPEAWAENTAETRSKQDNNRQRQLELKVDLLSKDVKECMNMLKSILEQR